MDFRGPEPGEFVDVKALNRAYLDHLRHNPGPAPGSPRAAAARLAALGPGEVRRLAHAPFLLFSLREDDAAYWHRILGDRATGDLFDVADGTAAAAGRIAAAALAFVWQLARQDAHLARLVCGASPRWCDMLADRPLVELLACCAAREDLLAPRRANDQDFWQRLLGAGTSGVETVRKAAHITALQVVLTRSDRGPAGRLDAAACRFPGAATRRGEAPEGG